MSVESLKQAFVKSLEIPADTDFSKLKYRSVRQWDSVAHMSLVAELEGTFDVMLDAEEVIDLSSFDKAIEILGHHDVTFQDA